MTLYPASSMGAGFLLLQLQFFFRITGLFYILKLMKILVIEDERELSKSICTYLEDRHYTCEAAYNFYTALEKTESYEYSCIILDITLPNGSGLQLLEQLKKNKSDEGVLIISAKSSVDDKVKGLQTGADDYLAKPFHLSELGARVAAIIRRKSFGGNNILRFENITLNLESRTLEVAGEPVVLTRKEYELLLYFISNKNRVVTKEAIVEHLWGDDYDTTGQYDFLYSHIKNLRKKLTAHGTQEHIKAVYGMGYKFIVNS
jgi:DNA-binding response OmpR family regulator